MRSKKLLTEHGDALNYQRQKPHNAKEARMEDIEAKIKELIVEKLGVSEDQIKPEAHFIDDLGADSLDTVELVMALEENFDIEIPDEDAEKLTTVGAAIDYIKSKLENK